MAQMVKNLPAAGSTPGSGGSPPWRRELLTNQVFLPGKFHDKGTRWAIQSMGSQRVGHDWVTNSSTLQVYDMWVKEKSGNWPRNPTITYKIISLGKICFTHSLQNSQYMFYPLPPELTIYVSQSSDSKAKLWLLHWPVCTYFYVSCGCCI